MSSFFRQSLKSIREGKEVYIKALVVRHLHAAQLSEFQTNNFTGTSLVEQGTPTEIETPLVSGIEGRLVINILSSHNPS